MIAPVGLERAVAMVGDRWSLLLVAALLDGSRRFGDLSALVTGIAPNVLSQRLKQLEAQGVVVAEPYSSRPPRVAYRLSAAGAELAGPLVALARWGAARSGQADGTRHRACGTPLEPRWYCPTCARLVEEGQADEGELFHL